MDIERLKKEKSYYRSSEFRVGYLYSTDNEKGRLYPNMRLYKITLNKISKLDNYPIPKIKDLYLNIAVGVQFTILDFSNARMTLI